MRIIVADTSIPGRYEITAYSGRRGQPQGRYCRRRDAERVAHRILSECFDERTRARFTSVEVTDRINGTTVYQERSPRKHYG